MPSPISRTWPTSWTLSFSRYWSISARRTEAISSALNLMAGFLDQLGADGIDLSTNRGIVQVIADPDNQAADQVRVHFFLQDRLVFHQLPQLREQFLPLIGWDRHGRSHVDRNPMQPLIVE